jgi:MerR family transcriptional regulator, light-induced transcriptional regulator
MNRRERRALGEKLRAGRSTIAESVNEEFFRRHPDWRERYGQKGVEHGREDACFHIDFLRGAVEADSVASFQDYASWTAGMLSARGIAAEFLAENLRQVGDAARTLLSPAEQEHLESYVRVGIAAACQAQREGPRELELTCRLYTEAILRGERRGATAIAMEAIENGTSLLDVYVDILQAAQFEVGRRWETNRITVAEEHMATAITQYVIAQLYSRIERTEALKGRMVLAGVQGELHQVGSNIIADALEANGWDVRFLGTNMPHAGILRAVEEHRAGILGISVCMLLHIPQLITLIESAERAFGRNTVRVIVGGGAFHRAPDLWKEVGAHGFGRDARHALEVIETLTG